MTSIFVKNGFFETQQQEGKMEVKSFTSNFTYLYLSTITELEIYFYLIVILSI